MYLSWFCLCGKVYTWLAEWLVDWVGDRWRSSDCRWLWGWFGWYGGLIGRCQRPVVLSLFPLKTRLLS